MDARSVIEALFKPYEKMSYLELVQARQGLLDRVTSISFMDKWNPKNRINSALFRRALMIEADAIDIIMRERRELERSNG